MTPQDQLPSQFQPHPVGVGPTDDEKLWGLLAHVLANVAMFLGPILALAIKGNQSPYVRRHSIEALNFNLTLFIGYALSGALAIVLVGFCTAGVLGVLQLVLSIIAGVAAFQGRDYRYPFVIRFIKE